MDYSMPTIEDVVNLLGLERDPRSKGGTSSFNVKCPLCGDRKYHMNINTRKNVYHCVKCSGDDKNTGVLDLYGRVRFGTPHITGPSGNGKELRKKLMEELGRGDNLSPAQWAKPKPMMPKLPEIPECKVADDETLDKVYSLLFRFRQFKLTEEHRANLVKRGLTDEIIKRNGYRSIPNDFSWIDKYPKAKRFWKENQLWKEKTDWLKRVPDERLIAGMIVATVMQKEGVSLEGVPGTFKLKNVWFWNLEPGMLIPTRNRDGLIVCIQTRLDKGDLRYKTLSAKGLPYAVNEGISRAHFPLGNAGPAANVETLITEGPLKADVASALYGGPSYFIALQGVTNTRELPEIFDWLKICGVSIVNNAFDMDKLCNRNVRKASKGIERKAAAAGLRFQQMCWDTEYAAEKWKELNSLCKGNGVYYKDASRSVFVQIAYMAKALEDVGIQHSYVGEEKNYWKDQTKGIDDYLLSRKQS